jgi:hypothetical protein
MSVHEVHEHTDSGTGAGMVVGLLLGLVVLGLLALLFFGNGLPFRSGGSTTTPSNNPTNIQVNPPSQPAPNVQINPPASGGSTSGGSTAPSNSAPGGAPAPAKP